MKFHQFSLKNIKMNFRLLFATSLLSALRVKGKGNVERKYFYQDSSFQVESFDTSLIKINQQIRKLLEFKYSKTNCHGGCHFRLCDVTFNMFSLSGKQLIF